MGWHIIREGKRYRLAREDLHKLFSRAHQFRRPLRGMKEDIVLADEMELLRFRIRPPLAPGILLTRNLTPLNWGGEITDHSLEPNVNTLARFGPACDRDGHAPIEIACDRARLEPFAFDLAQRLSDDSIAHMRSTFFKELLHIGFELGKVEIKMLSITQLERAIASLGTRIDQFLGFKHVAAVIALIGAGVLVAADVAGPFHITVGQEFVRAGRVPLLAELFEQETVLLQSKEHRL